MTRIGKYHRSVHGVSRGGSNAGFDILPPMRTQSPSICDMPWLWGVVERIPCADVAASLSRGAGTLWNVNQKALPMDRQLARMIQVCT